MSPFQGRLNAGHNVELIQSQISVLYNNTFCPCVLQPGESDLLQAVNFTIFTLLFQYIELYIDTLCISTKQLFCGDFVTVSYTDL